MYIKNKIGQPSIKEGKDGDLKFRKDFGGKSSVFGKVGGIWEKIGLNVVGSPNTGNIALFNNKNSLYSTGKLALKKNTLDCNSKLKVGTIDAATSDTDKFLVSDSGVLKYRTGTEVLSDIGAGTGDITGVTITTDSGAGSKAEDTAGSADFSLLGSNGVGITNSGETITAVAVPAEIDHDSLNNFASNEHYTQANIIATGALDSGSITSGFGNIDTGSSTITTTGAITGGSFVGQSIWVEYPFEVTNGVAGRPYYRDVDDLYGDFRKWDDYDTSPTAISRGDVAGHYVVPENCTLKSMQAVVTNATSDQNIDIHIYTGTPNLNTASATTLALAGGAVTTVSISTVSYNYSASDTYDVDLAAGDIIVPMVEHDSDTGNQTFRGNITLKLVTR